MFTRIPSETLKQLVRLCERKEALMAQIQEIDRQMSRLGRKFERTPGSSVHKAPVTFSTTRKKKRAGRRV